MAIEAKIMGRWLLRLIMGRWLSKCCQSSGDGGRKDSIIINDETKASGRNLLKQQTQ